MWGAGAVGSSESTSSTVAAAIRRAVASRVSTTIPSRQSVVQAAPDPAAPSMPTRHTRHAPNGSWRSSKQSVGTAPPAARTASSTVVPGATAVAVPSISI